MKYYEIVFSPTGGTKKVADILINKLADESAYIDLCDRDADFSFISLKEDNFCLIAVPSYGGRVPAAATERIRQLKGNGAKAILVVVYGNREYEDTLIELKDTLDACGFISMAAVTAIAEHSIVRKFAAGRPDAQDTKELESFAEKIKERIAGNSSYKLAVPGNRPYKESKSLPMHPSANKSCTKCGICAKNCPVGAISMENLTQTDNERCISCMRCISVCPNGSRELNKLVLAGAAQMLKKSCSERKENRLV
ncbi:MAG: EFR1 family ferrodoxin [Oliverpabstia sp.]